MDNTFSLGLWIEKESNAPVVVLAQMEEERTILSAIGDVDDMDLEQEDLPDFEPLGVPMPNPIPVFVNVVNIEQQLMIQGVPATAPEVIVIEDDSVETTSVRNESSDRLSGESVEEFLKFPFTFCGYFLSTALTASRQNG